MDTFPLPRIDDLLDLLANTAYFSNVMPFGLCNAPATFQRLMEMVLAGLTSKKCFVYLDDILVMGSSFEEHLDNLTEVLQRLRQAGFRLKPTNYISVTLPRRVLYT